MEFSSRHLSPFRMTLRGLSRCAILLRICCGLFSSRPSLVVILLGRLRLCFREWYKP